MRIVLLALFGLACSGDKNTGGGSDSGHGGTGSTEAVPFSDCDPLVPTACGYPFPSTFSMVEDDTTATGWRVNLGETTIPATVAGVHPTPTFWNERDGWSVGGPAMVHLPGATLTGLNSFDDIGASLQDDARSILLDLDTGERVAHWVERDVRLGDTDHSVLMLRPAAPLDYGHRYAVAFRNVEDASGAALAPTEAFAALQSGTQTGDSDVDQRQALYDELLFPALEGEGWSRDEVQVAWDFVTASFEGISRQGIAARDRALEAADAGIAYTIDEVQEAPNEHTAFRLKGTLTAPLLTVEDDVATVLTRDDDGLPFVNGTTEVPFTIVVPNSLVDEARPGALVQYGHGLLGGQGEVHGGYLAEMADRYGWVLFAVDWTGMKTVDAIGIAGIILTDFSDIAAVPERSVQGFVEFEIAMLMMRREMLEEPLLQVDDGAGGAVSLIDPDQRYYYGNSQGGILGASYTAFSSQISRGVLGVPGGPYSLLLTRSTGFNDFLNMFTTQWPDQKDISLLVGLVQTLWDSGEGIGYAKAARDGLIPGAPDKQVLLQVAQGDKQVTPLGAHVYARGFGAALVEDPYQEVYGLDTVASGATGSGIVEFDYGLEIPVENVPPPEGNDDSHEWPRRDRAGQDQIDHFFTTGELKHFCDGPCGEPDRGQSAR